MCLPEAGRLSPPCRERRLLMFSFNPDYAIGFNFGRVTGNEKRDVLSQSPRNHSRRFMASDNFRMRRLPSFTM